MRLSDSMVKYCVPTVTLCGVTESEHLGMRRWGFAVTIHNHTRPHMEDVWGSSSMGKEACRARERPMSIP